MYLKNVMGCDLTSDLTTQGLLNARDVIYRLDLPNRYGNRQLPASHLQITDKMANKLIICSL